MTVYYRPDWVQRQRAWILNKEYGYMVCAENNEISKVPLEEVAGKLKTVDPECSTIKEAKMLGISFGDE